jgi:hypothetical protein
MNLPQQETPAEAKGLVLELWEQFHENYQALKSGQISLSDEPSYNVAGVPGPCQYQLLMDFFGFIEGEEQWIWERKESMRAHYIFDNSCGEPAIFPLLQEFKSASDLKGKEVFFVSGSFWQFNQEARKRIVLLLNELYKENIKVTLITKASEEDLKNVNVDKFLDKKLSSKGKKRRAFHFILAADKYLFFEFPHTESTWFRLNMLLDLDKIPYKKGKSKAGLLKFLNGVIQGK